MNARFPATISVILAAYNGEMYLAEQLRSLFAQTRLPDEILIGDDSPGEATEQAVRAVLPEAPPSVHIDYRRNPRQLGFIANFSSLAERAAGDYIFFCDQDDIWLKEKIQVLSDALYAHPECDLAACDSMRVTEDLKPLQRLVNRKGLSRVKQELRNKRAFHHFWLADTLFSGHNIAVRRTGITSGALPFPLELGFHDMWLVLFFAIQEKILFVDRVLTLYRLHTGNLSTPKKRGAGKAMGERLKEISSSPQKDFLTGMKNMQTRRDLLLSRIPESRIPQENLALIRNSLIHNQWRLDNMRNPSACGRMLGTLSHFSDYFRYSNGFRSVVRDLFL